MGTPEITPNQDDLMARLQKTTSASTAAPAPTPEAGDDLRSRLEAATGSKSITMVGPKGEKTQVPQNQVADMRQKIFAVTPDNQDVQKMVTVDGKIAYVLPDEVTKFEDTGATHILPDGRFLVKNMRSDNTEFPDSIPDPRERAVTVAKTLGDDQMKKSTAAEQKYWTSKEGLKEEAKGLANVALVGGGTLAAIAAPGPVIAGARAAAPAVLNTGALILASPAGQMVVKEGAKYLLKGAGAGLGWKLANMWFGK